MRWARLAFSAVLVASSASVAAAECAWVFWKESELFDIPAAGHPKRKIEWKLHDAYKTQEQCEKGKYAVWSHEVEYWTKTQQSSPHLEKVDKVAGAFLSLSFKGKDGSSSSHTSRYLCLPDTIDPREKEKG